MYFVKAMGTVVCHSHQRTHQACVVLQVPFNAQDVHQTALHFKTQNAGKDNLQHKINKNAHWLLDKVADIHLKDIETVLFCHFCQTVRNVRPMQMADVHSTAVKIAASHAAVLVPFNIPFILLCTKNPNYTKAELYNKHLALAFLRRETAQMFSVGGNERRIWN